VATAMPAAAMVHASSAEHTTIRRCARHTSRITRSILMA
jgi:hypothetical protein